MEIKKLAVIGAGVVGAGIAHVAAQSGFRVNLMDRAPLHLAEGFHVIEKYLKRNEETGELTASDCEDVRNRIHSSESLEGAAKDAQLVVEAVTEDMGLKKSVFQKLDAICEESTIFVSSTAGFSITELASVTSRPDRFIGMHFFQPVPAMELVEIIRGHLTSDETATTVKSVAQQLGKTPLQVKDAPGFLVSRILVPMINEAIFVLQEGGATAEEIDQSMKLGANHPMGPLALADLVGLDRLLHIQQGLYDEFRDSKYRPAPLLVKMVRAGQLGRKAGIGFFKYE